MPTDRDEGISEKMTKTERALSSSVALLALLLAGGIGDAIAQTADRVRPISTATQARHFSIPAKPLLAALADFTAATGIQVLRPSTDAITGRSQAVVGAFTPDVALRQLLAASGLSYRFTSASTAVVYHPVSENSTFSHTDGSTVLGPIVIEGASETATGPVDGYIAHRSASGSKTDTPLLETPQSISVVTADQVKAQNAQTVGQALRYTPGIISEHGGGVDGARYDFQTIRGFGYVGQHYADGMKATFGTGNLAMPQFDPYFLERVEAVRGPSSVLYGQNTPGGIINMISKRPSETPQREVSLQYGSHDRVQAAFDFSGPITEDGTFLYRLSGLGRHSNSQVDFVEEERFAIAPSLTWKPSADTSLTLYATYQHDPEGGLYGNLLEDGVTRPLPNGTYVRRSLNPGDPDFDAFDRKQASIGYEFDHRFNEVWSLRHNARYLDTQADVRGFFGGGFIPPSSIARMTLGVQADTAAFTTDTQLQADFETGALTHKLLIGADYLHSNWNNVQGIGMGAPPIDMGNPVYGVPVPVPNGFPNAGMFTDATQKQSQFGVYLQDQIKLDRFLFTLGGRYDWARGTNDSRSWAGAPPSMGGVDTSVYQKLSDDAFSGRAALTYLFDNGIAPYLSYSTSFVPTLGQDAAGNAFRPITGKQWEAGVKYEPVGWDGFFAASIFQATQQNVLTPDPAGGVCTGGTPCQVQAGEVRVRGVELEGKVNLWSSFDLIASYTYLDSEVTRSTGPNLGKSLTGVPQHMAGLWADYTFHHGALEGLGIGAGVRYFGSAFIDAGNSRKVPGYTVVDAAIRYDFGKKTPSLDGLELAVNVSNLFDETTIACAAENWCNYGPGRSVFGTLSYRW